MRHLACRAPRTGRRTFLTALGALGVATVAACSRVSDGTASSQESPPAPPSPTAPLLPPADLNARLAEVKAGKVVVLHVGPQYLWGKSHIPGSRWVGEAGTDDGLAALQTALMSIPADTEIVAYCGCCPFSHCPNIQPTRQALAGRAKDSFLDLPTNLRTDWIEKGFPVERA
jgi:thiosulfate/3-mercaptopyruvate sulfurtransferase